MPRNVKNIHSQTKQVLAPPLMQNHVRLDDLDAQRKTVSLEKVFLGNHGHGVGMAHDKTAMAPLDSGSICHVIPVTMGENQQSDFFVGKMTVAPLRSVEKNQPFRRLDQKAIRLVGATSKSFELKHGKAVEFTLLIFLAQPARQGDQLILNA